MYDVDDSFLDDFFMPLYEDSFRHDASEVTGIALPECNEYLDGYINEARYALGRIRKFLVPGCRILEVGAGLGLVSLFLASRGFSVVANNADQEVFSPMASLRQRVMAQYSDINLSVVVGNIELLRFPVDDGFDFIFSLNVLEHVANVRMALISMSAMLKPSGCMWHSCPNYSFPYEPHLARFLLPVFPDKTLCLLPSLAEQKYGVWNTLNFITARKLKGLMYQVGLTLTFNRNVFYEHLLRLLDDPHFRSRHIFAWYIVGALKKAGILGLFRFMPATWVTPMEFVAWHRAGSVPGLTDIDGRSG